MTFAIPEEVAAVFLRRVPSRGRSRYVTEAIQAKLKERDQRLAQSCEVANSSQDVHAVELEWDALKDSVAEPWHDPSR